MSAAANVLRPALSLQLLLEVVLHMDIVDVGRGFSQVNRRTYELIYSKAPLEPLPETAEDTRQRLGWPCQTLWAELFRNAWDDLPLRPDDVSSAPNGNERGTGNVDWVGLLTRRQWAFAQVRRRAPAAGLFDRDGSGGKRSAPGRPPAEDRVAIMETLLDMMNTRASKQPQATPPSRNSKLLEKAFPHRPVYYTPHAQWIFPGWDNGLRSNWYLPSRNDRPEEDLQLAIAAEIQRARLHCLHGVRTFKGPAELHLDIYGGCHGLADNSTHDVVTTGPFSLSGPTARRVSQLRTQEIKATSPPVDFRIFHRLMPEGVLVPILGGDGASADIIMRRKARDVVYDIGRFSLANSHGPFKPFRWIPTEAEIRMETETTIDEERTTAHVITDDEAQALFLRFQARQPADAVMDDDAMETGTEEEDDDDDDDDPYAQLSSRHTSKAAMKEYKKMKESEVYPALEGDSAEEKHVEEDLQMLKDAGFDIVEEAGTSRMHSRDDDDDDSEDEEDARLPRGFLFDHADAQLYKGKLAHQSARETAAAKLGKDKPLKRVEWQPEIDWRLLEAIMITLYSTMTIDRARHGLAQSFQLPKLPHESLAVWQRRVLQATSFPSGWSHTRGASPPARRPYDWANIEGIWVGTYCFIDYRRFIPYAGQLARWRRLPKDLTTRSIAMRALQNRPRLAHATEVAGDLLQLRMKVLRDGEAMPHISWDSNGLAAEIDRIDPAMKNDEQYPLLKFSGTSLTYDDGDTPNTRGTIYGFAHPIFSKKLGPGGARIVEGTRWRMRFLYDGEDRWEVNYVQAGAPGSRAPLLGVWSSPMDGLIAQLSPVGPTGYVLADSDMSWEEAEELLTEQLGLTPADPRYRLRSNVAAST